MAGSNGFLGKCVSMAPTVIGTVFMRFFVDTVAHFGWLIEDMVAHWRRGSSLEMG